MAGTAFVMAKTSFSSNAPSLGLWCDCKLNTLFKTSHSQYLVAGEKHDKNLDFPRKQIKYNNQNN